MPLLTSSPGTYALQMKVALPVTHMIGALGIHFIPAGIYFYVGSAFGTGGLRGRLSHHMKTSHQPHWHIDYLRPYAEIEQIWYTYSVRCEHTWASVFQSFPGCTLPIPGFGSSDCSCPAHLFHFKQAPDPEALRGNLASGMHARSVQCLPITMVPNPHISRL
jgi:Uri superfamily endonuclease